jgi:hypothetical protein
VHRKLAAAQSLADEARKAPLQCSFPGLDLYLQLIEDDGIGFGLWGWSVGFGVYASGSKLLVIDSGLVGSPDFH